MATDVYVDSTDTGSGDLGTITEPYISIASVVAGDLDAGGGTTIHIAGTHYLSSKQTVLKNGGIGNPHIWKQWSDKTIAKLVGGIRIDDNATYKFTASATTDEYYLELAGGGDPSLAEVKAGTVDGYYRSSSVASANQATEQRGTVGSLTDLQWGWGDNDTLGFSTYYIKVPSGGDPTDYEIIIAQIDKIFDVGFNYHQLDDLILSHSNLTALDIRAALDANRCVLANADFNCVTGGSASTAGNLYNCIFSQGHRAASVTSTGTINIHHGIFHNNHLGIRATNVASTIDVKNVIQYGAESGFAEILGATPAFTESHNVIYPRLNDSVQKLGYISVSTHGHDWGPTDGSDIPPGYDIDTVIADAPNTLIDPLFVAVDLHDWAKCNFRLQSGSPAIAKGVPIAEVTTDYIEEAYDPVAPNAGIYTGSVSGGGGIMQPIMASGY